MEAFEGYWRKVPSVKRLVFKSIPDETTRAAALKRGEVEDLFQRQARELDRKKREELLHQIQHILHDKVVHAPIWESGFIRGVGPRVEEAALSLIPAFPYSAPLEEVRLKRQEGGVRHRKTEESTTAVR